MADMMTFPNTVEEFMEQYKIVDTEQVYTNGTEMVPIFRMKQWFEHLPTIEPERKKGKWISVEDRLPELSENVVLPDEHGDLIDRDEIVMPYDICDGNEAMEFVNKTPVIIAAERSERCG